MGCWLKQYKLGVAWFCNTTDKRVSPIMPIDEALLANIFAERFDSLWCHNCPEARLVKSWPDARKKAKQFIKESSQETIEAEILGAYGFTSMDDATIWD